MTKPSDDADRVLLLTPTGRDAKMVRERLEAAGVSCAVCADVEALVAGLDEGAGAALIAQEALDARGAEALLRALDAQQPWSDVPVLLLTFALSRRTPNAERAAALFERANVTLLQRPLRLNVLLSVVRSAVRARRRQYQMRDLVRELERAVQLGETFVSILGHDLRTPLGAIRMSAELIVRTSEDGRALRPAGRILSSADRMARMIEQVLDFARVRQGQGIRLRVARANLEAVCRQVLQELGDANPQARIEVSCAGDLMGAWDLDRLAQVVSNLAGNAVQHGAAGSPVAVELDGTAKASVRLRISNHGAIAAQALPTLFEPFKRSDPSRPAQGGLGLGLFIAREIVRAHGGDIGVRTTDDDMTIFEVVLPREAQVTGTAVLTPG